MAGHATQTILDIFTLDSAGYLCFTKHFIRQCSWLPFGSWQKKKKKMKPPCHPLLPTMHRNEWSGRAIIRTYSESRRKSQGAPGSEPIPWAVLFSSIFAVLTLDFSCGYLIYQLIMYSASSECRGHFVTDSVLSLLTLLLLVSLCQH